MRLKETKGAHPFQIQFMDHFTPNRFTGGPTSTSNADAQQGFAPFTSAHRQRLVLSRMKRVACIDLHERMSLATRDEYFDIVQDNLKGNEPLRALDIYRLLTTTGSFRPHAEMTLGAQIKLLTQQVLADKAFVIFPEGENLNETQQIMVHAQAHHMETQNLPMVTREAVRKCVDILEAWLKTEEGEKESFVGSLKKFFPVHEQEELVFLRHKWATLSILCQPYTRGKANEDQTSLTYYQEDAERKHLTVRLVCATATASDAF